MSRPQLTLSEVSRRLTASRLLAALLTTAVVFLGACESGDASRKIDDARVAHAQGRLDEAQQLYEQALESEPDNAAALVGLANIHLDREETEAAGAVFARLDELELDRRSEQLVERSRGRYNRLIYESARGDGPANPADPDLYETALIGLFNAEGDQQYAEELVELFIRQARSSLGVENPGEPVAPTSAFVQDAQLDALRAALEGYQRLSQRDERLTRVLNPPDAIRSEAEAMVIALGLEVFDREFDERFNSMLRGTLLEEERFNSERNMLRILFTSPEPYQGDQPEGEALEAFQQDLALSLVIEELTDLAYQVKGIERGTNRPLQLGRTREDVLQAYSGIEIVNFDFPRSGIVTIEVLAPYHLLPRTAYRLEQFLEWQARQPAGTGAGTGRGTGAGTGLGTGETASEGTGAPTE